MAENFSVVPQTPMRLIHLECTDSENPAAISCSTAGCRGQRDAAVQGSSRTEKWEVPWVVGFFPRVKGVSAWLNLLCTSAGWYQRMLNPTAHQKLALYTHSTHGDNPAGLEVAKQNS